MSPPPNVPLPAGVRLEAGHGGLPRLAIETHLASGHIYLHGAQVTHFQPAGEEPVLFVSQQSLWTPGKAIRGGIPICLPWFGPHPTDPAAPQHGITRLTEWSLVSAKANATGGIEIALAMDSAIHPAYPCPQPFKAVFTAVFGTKLTVAVEIENSGTESMPVSEALHAYLRVGDVRQVSVDGLEDRSYCDNTDARKIKTGSAAPLTLTGETDRVYLDTTRDIVVTDPMLGRKLRIAKRDSASTVVWNPWSTKAAAMADLGDHEWTGMLCIETANADTNSFQLAPGARHAMAATLSCEV